MTVTVLKTEFVKSDPIQINYRDYKNYNSVNFNEDLWNIMNSDISFSKDYSKFQNVLGEVLNKHAPIMNRSRCKNSYFKNKTVANWEKYRKLRNDCVRVRKKVKRECFLKTLILILSMRTKHFGKRLNPILLTNI